MTTSALHRLQFTRPGVDVAWAGLLAVSLPDHDLATGVLLVGYPLADVASATARAPAGPVVPGTGRYGTIAVGATAALGLAVAFSSGPGPVLAVWGVWAVVAGTRRLCVALLAADLPGRSAMTVSGAGSVLAGPAFVLVSLAGAPSLSVLIVYALVSGALSLTAALAPSALTGSSSTTQHLNAAPWASHTSRHGAR